MDFTIVEDKHIEVYMSFYENRYSKITGDSAVMSPILGIKSYVQQPQIIAARERHDSTPLVDCRT